MTVFRIQLHIIRVGGIAQLENRLDLVGVEHRINRGHTLRSQLQRRYEARKDKTRQDKTRANERTNAAEWLSCPLFVSEACLRNRLICRRTETAQKRQLCFHTHRQPENLVEQRLREKRVAHTLPYETSGVCFGSDFLSCFRPEPVLVNRSSF